MDDTTAARPAQLYSIEVCYAGPDSAEIVALAAPQGWTIRQAVEASGLLARHAIDLEIHRVGIFGKLKSLDATVHAGDRIEIYRPLTADPNTARLRRAEKNRKTKLK